MNNRELIMAVAGLIIITIISYPIAEFIGRRKYIGFWWSFILLSTSVVFAFIPGIIAIALSPSAKKTPQKPNVIVYIICMVVTLLLLITSILMIPNDLKLGVSFFSCGLPILIYLIRYEKIVNQKPKYYYFKIFNSLTRKSSVISKEKYSLKTTNSSFVKPDMLYYIVESNTPVGPLTLQQVKERVPKAGTLTCRNGEKGWSKVEDLEELSAFVLYEPPPVPSNELKNEVKVDTTNSENADNQRSHDPINEKEIFDSKNEGSKNISNNDKSLLSWDVIMLIMLGILMSIIAGLLLK